ncbi:MAG: acetyltransferase [Bacteroidetes bacterium]|nr:acetyltransferase [Bacteroidota bacterium]
MILIGYSGHAFVVYGILTAAGKKVTGYCDREEKSYNPFSLTYYGTESSDAGLAVLQHNGFFIAVGDNGIREKIFQSLATKKIFPLNAIHPSAVIDVSATIAAQGVMIAARAVINPLAQIGTGAICNTGSIIEHECVVGNFAHIAPGAVLCGNVKVGHNSFVGANAVIKQGVTIGNNVMIGAGAVVLKDVPDNTTVVGVPAQTK